MEITKAQDHFSLNKIDSIISDYLPPDEDFDPSGSWRHEYDWYGIPAGRPWVFGSLILQREAGFDGLSRLTVDSRRQGKSGFSFFVHAEFSCQNDVLATPLSWNSSSKMAKEAGDKPYLNSLLEKRAIVEGNNLRIKVGEHHTEANIESPYTSKWCLMDAVQRLGGVETGSIDFSLVDEVDQVRQNQTLTFQKRASVSMSGGGCEMDAYIHIGHGVIPTVFWVDEKGRLLFVVSGLEILVLKNE